MKTLILLALAIVLTTGTLFAGGAIAAHAQTPDPVLIQRWGRSLDEAKSKAYQKAEDYAPYHLENVETGWDPMHIPHNYQYYCKLWIVPL